MRSIAVNIGDDAKASQYNDLRKDAFAAAHLLAHEQATPDLTLKVESGIYYVGTTRVVFAGGNSPSFTAPTTNPRIDLLVIDNAGTLTRVVGTEAASPSVPTYQTDKVVICEVYNRVGQTTIRDIDTMGQGYIQNDVRPFLGGSYISSNNQVATGANIQPSKLDAGNVDTDWLPSADNTRKLGSSARRWSELRAALLYGDGANITGIAVTKFDDTYTAGEAINASSTPQAVYVKASDGKIYLTDDDFDESAYKFLGFVAGGQNVSASASVKVTVAGLVTGFSSLTQNGFYYLSGTSGSITTTNGSRPFLVGFAVTTSILLIVPRGVKIRSWSDSLGAGTGGATHTITVGFKPKIMIGRSQAGNNADDYTFFVVGWGSTYALTFSGNSYFEVSDVLARAKDANPSWFSATAGNFTDTGFDITYNRSGIWSNAYQTVAGIAIGE